MVLMKKAQIVIMTILTLILVAITVFVVILTGKLDKMVDEEIHQEVVIEDEEEPSVDVKTVDALQDSFDALFSWEDIENLYEGQTDFWFVEVQDVDEE